MDPKQWLYACKLVVSCWSLFLSSTESETFIRPDSYQWVLTHREEDLD